MNPPPLEPLCQWALENWTTEPPNLTYEQLRSLAWAFDYEYLSHSDEWLDAPSSIEVDHESRMIIAFP